MLLALDTVPGFSWLDWAIVAAVLALVTWIGHVKSGKPEDLFDYYLGGGKLPWFAVALSIIATEISAVTFFAVPSFVARETGGSLLYLQIVLVSAVIARGIVAFALVPAYYERRIYSPYDFIGDRLGRSVRRMVTVVFMAGGVLAQSARVFVTAVIVEVLAHEQLGRLAELTGVPSLALAVAGMCAVAFLWTWMGGVATVVWTDVCLFVLFVLGLSILLWTLVPGIEGGLAGAISRADAAGKLEWVHPSWSMLDAYSLLSVVVGAGLGLVASYGTDQLMAQRILSCRSKRDARLAVLASNGAALVVALAFTVGIGLLGHYESHAMTAEGARLVAERPDRILPVYVREVLPAGLRGLVLAAAFAAAISSLDSILSALGQTTASLGSAWERRRGGEAEAATHSGKDAVRSSRLVVLVWAVVLGAAALFMQVLAEGYASLLDLAMAMSAIAGGPILAALLLAFLQRGGDRGAARGAAGYLWAAPLGLATITFAIWHGPTAYATSWWVAGGLFLAWLTLGLPRRRHPYAAIQTIWFGFSLFLVTRVAEVGDFDVVDATTGAVRSASIAWPWYAPIGALVTLSYSFLLDRPAGRVT